jgi:hypothetical protein
MLCGRWAGRVVGMNRTPRLLATPHLPRTAVDGYYDVGGQYVVMGNQVTFFWPRSTGLTPETLRWSYYRGQLTFTVVHVEGDSAGVVQYEDHPWRKVS